ncbi:MAG: glucosamine-6-phosphate deaminase [Acholeplasmatales bacterium]|jgi:glucosamine-6-phosphate deaminase|nr:glucosamine-6-phosphate deaminase [Acholeplasmatales bacterium]
MKLFIFKNNDTLYEYVSSVYIKKINENPNICLGLATGSTPIPLYNLLSKSYQKRLVDFSKVKTINLDEYLGLDENNSESYRYFMNENLFKKINISGSNTYLPLGTGNIDTNISFYNNLLANNSIDLLLLGLGSNGHIGFNEPNTSFNSTTHVVKLKKSTIKDNSRLFENIKLVPKKAITMGLKDIFNAKEIFLIANTKNKEKVIKKILEGKRRQKIPASILKNHPNTTIFINSNIALKLNLTGSKYSLIEENDSYEIFDVLK